MTFQKFNYQSKTVKIFIFLFVTIILLACTNTISIAGTMFWDGFSSFDESLYTFGDANTGTASAVDGRLQVAINVTTPSAADDTKYNFSMTPYLPARYTYIQTTINIPSLSGLPTDGLSTDNLARVRLKGCIYKNGDLTTDGEDRLHDVEYYFGLKFKKDGAAYFEANVVRATNSDFSTEEELFDQIIPIDFVFGADYVLSVEFTGDKLVFSCNDFSLTYNVELPFNFTPHMWSNINSRLYLDTGETGNFVVYYDNIYIYGASPGDSAQYAGDYNLYFWRDSKLIDTTTINITNDCYAYLLNGDFYICTASGLLFGDKIIGLIGSNGILNGVKYYEDAEPSFFSSSTAPFGPIEENPYAGEYSGSFSGEDSGEWEFTVTDDGSITGTAISTQSGETFTMKGLCGSDGAFAIEGIGNDEVVKLEGTINESGVVEGTWSYVTSGSTGSLEGTTTSVTNIFLTPASSNSDKTGCFLNQF